MSTVELTQPPSLGPLYARAAAGMLPGRGSAGAAGAELPDTELVLRGVPVDVPRLAEYARVCGFRLSGTLPATYPHVLAFPLALSLMTGPDFPFPAAGVVHVANRITQHRPLPVDTRLDLAVRAEDLRAHERGRQVDLVSEARVDGEPVWREVSTYLHRERTGGGDGSRSGGAERAAAPEPTAVWRVDAGVGRAYARVSGDRNPIHISTLAARAFGFRRRIAHGMWSKARCLAHLEPRLPEAYEVAVRFQKPIVLPSTVHFSSSPEGDGVAFSLNSHLSGNPHLPGSVDGLPGTA